MTDTKRPLKVFLSYASQDRPLVRELSRRLVGEGWIETWFDEKSLLPGQDWRLKIEEAVEDSDVIIICLSNNSVTKEGYVQKELRYAREMALEKPDGTIFLIPLRLDECEVPRGLRFYQWVDYFGKKQDEAYFALIQSLKLRHEQKLRLEATEHFHQEKEDQESENKTAWSEAVVTEITSIGEDVDSAQSVPDFLLPKAVKNEFIKAPKERGKRETAEKPKPRTSKPKPIEQPARKTSKVEPKPTEIQTVQRNLATQVAYWGIGIIAVIFIISMLALINWNKPTSLVPTATSESLPTEITDPKGVTMRLVPAGEFTMGSEISYDEKPIHQVYLDAFYMDIYEVTNAAYKACVTEGVCSPPKNTSRYDGFAKENHPVVYVDWNQANAYCEWRDASLPTEAQWEKAAGGDDGRTYPWGEGISCIQANYHNGSNYCVGDTTEVGGYESGKSPYGIYDMAGNVWEWVADWYDSDYYASSPSSNPLGPSSGQYRVLRGGSWVNFDEFVRSADRFRDSPSVIYFDFGFRCAKDAMP